MTTARSTEIPGIYSTVLMSPNNLPKSLDSNLLQAHQSIIKNGAAERAVHTAKRILRKAAANH